MKKWKHINLEQRKTIASCISHNCKLIDISKILNLDPRSISREVKRNRIPTKYQKTNASNCDKLNRWPFVCANCKLKYKNCPFIQFKYVASRILKCSSYGTLILVDFAK